MSPTVDINLFVHNGAKTVAAAVESVLAQTWRSWLLTLIDDGSTDGTIEILKEYSARDTRIRLKRNRSNVGSVGAFQRGFWLGDADYVMPKSADDLIAPDYVSQIMSVLLEHPASVMVHAAGLSFEGAGHVKFEYPVSHRLHAVGSDAIARACHVMDRYTSSPSFWGIYRRDAVDRLMPIAYRAGWDHVLIAELALYGEVRHVAETLFWRRGTGRPVIDLARAATSEAARGLSLDNPITDPLWRLPCITTAYAHVEMLTQVRLPQRSRDELIGLACSVFARRWRSVMLRELSAARIYVNRVADSAKMYPIATRLLAHLQVTRLLTAASFLLPDQDLGAEWRRLADIRPEALCLT